MDLVKILIIPPTMDQLALIRFLLIATWLLFIPFVTAFFGVAWLSVVLGKMGRLTRNRPMERLGDDMIIVVGANRWLGVMWGVLPLITLTVLYAHFAYDSPLDTLTWMGIGSLLHIVGLWLVYAYRRAIEFRRAVDSASPEKESSGYSQRVLDSGWWGALIGAMLMEAGLWLVLASVDIIARPELWSTVTSMWQLMAQWQGWLLMAIFWALSLVMGPAAYIFCQYYWFKDDAESDGATRGYQSELSMVIALVSGLFFPILALIYATQLSSAALTFSSLLMWGLAIVGMGVVLIVAYSGIRFSERRHDKWVLPLGVGVAWVMMLGVVLPSESALFQHSIVVSAASEAMHKEEEAVYQSKFAMTTMSGEDVFKKVCSACHKMDSKLVGPPLATVLSKYKEDIEAFRVFVSNPVKINPDYPPMPNPGLKPAEVRAVTTYLLEQVK